MKITSFILENIVWFILIILLTIFSISIDGFFQSGIFINILRQSTFVGILAVGLSCAVISGHMDLSIESVMGFSAMLAAFLTTDLGGNYSVFTSLVIALSFGVFIGLFNGYLIVYFKINAFIITLSTFISVRGFSLLLTGGKSIYGLPNTFHTVGSDDFLGIPYLALIAIGIFLLFHTVLTNTKIGRYIYCIGGNENAPFRSGVNVKKITLFVFVLSGVLAALAGWLLAARTNGATANLGTGILFEAFAAVVIGGVSLTGGEGKMSGVFAGVLLLSSIATAINIMALPPHYMHVIRGALVLFAILLDSSKNVIRLKLVNKQFA